MKAYPLAKEDVDVLVAYLSTLKKQTLGFVVRNWLCVYCRASC